MTAAEPRPARPATRWDDRTCGADGCTCHHDPDLPWSPSGDAWPCDRGHTPARGTQTTPGVRGPGGAHITSGVRSDDAVAKCQTCAAARERARQAREANP